MWKCGNLGESQEHWNLTNSAAVGSGDSRDGLLGLLGVVCARM